MVKKDVHADAETSLLFTKPAANPVNYAPGINNRGEEGDFTLESMDASFRYPMDFSYHIQNFSAIAYQKTVKEGQEATVAYSFIPADAFAGRPIGLSINLAY